MRQKEIERAAADERTQWERVIEIFNDRFFVPFRLSAENKHRVALGQEDVLKLVFKFEEGDESTDVAREELLSVLSNGEKKALYILNVLFEMEARKASGRETLFVIDDLADSFAVLPGGIGTMEEFFEAFTWLQLGYHEKPIALLNTAGYFDGLIAFLIHMSGAGFLDASTLSKLIVEKTPEELLSRISAAL